MLRNILIGQYYPGNSMVHRLDPRTKIVAIAAYVIVLFLITVSWGYGMAMLFTVGVVLVARLPARMVVRSLRPVIFLLALTVFLHGLVSGREGTVLAAMGPMVFTDAGLWFGFQMGLRIGLLIVTASVLTLTTSPIQLTDGIEQLFRPLKRFGLPIHEVAMMMTIALRFIPTLLEETERIMKAQLARGADWQTGGLRRRLRSLVPILVPLFVSVFRRADDLAVAMEARCYRGGQGRTRFRELRMTGRDAVAGGVVAVMLFLILWVGR